MNILQKALLTATSACAFGATQPVFSQTPDPTPATDEILRILNEQTDYRYNLNVRNNPCGSCGGMIFYQDDTVKHMQQIIGRIPTRTDMPDSDHDTLVEPHEIQLLLMQGYMIAKSKDESYDVMIFNEDSCTYEATTARHADDLFTAIGMTNPEAILQTPAPEAEEIVDYDMRFTDFMGAIGPLNEKAIPDLSNATRTDTIRMNDGKVAYAYRGVNGENIRYRLDVTFTNDSTETLNGLEKITYRLGNDLMGITSLEGAPCHTGWDTYAVTRTDLIEHKSVRVIETSFKSSALISVFNR